MKMQKLSVVLILFACVSSAFARNAPLRRVKLSPPEDKATGKYDQRKACFNFKSGARKKRVKDWDLGYGFLAIANEDWFIVSPFDESRTVIEDLGELKWTDSFKLPVLTSHEVSLARAHDAWAAAYEEERVRIVAAVAEHLLDIQHVGSTSISGVPAKPILDILVGVRDFDEATACVGPMIAIGYTYRGENGIPRRHYFVKGAPRTHHVHMVEIGSDTWRETLRFRDLLRMNPALASEYARGKERLALLHSDNREAYQREKDTIVERILARDAYQKWL